MQPRTVQTNICWQDGRRTERVRAVSWFYVIRYYAVYHHFALRYDTPSRVLYQEHQKTKYWRFFGGSQVRIVDDSHTRFRIRRGGDES
jgi:hypothetical protein